MKSSSLYRKRICKSVLLCFVFLFSCSENQPVNTVLKKENTKERDSISKSIKKMIYKGNHHRNIADYKQALDLHFQALRKAELHKDTFNIVLALNNIATDLRRTSSNTEATQYHLKALDVIGKKSYLKKSKAIAINGLGNVYLSLKKPKEAEAYFKQSLQIETELQSDLGQAINYANIGGAKELTNDYQQALSYYQKSLEFNTKIKSSIGIAICKAAIGELLIRDGKYEEGIVLMNQAINLVKSSKDIFHVLEIELSLCKQLINLKKFTEAKRLINSIIEKSKKINSNEHLVRIYELLTRWHKLQNKYSRALKAKENAILHKTNLNKQTNEAKIIEIENRFKNEQAVQKINLLTKENKLSQEKRDNQLMVFVALLTTAIVLLTVLYFTAKKRKQVNYKLKEMSDFKSRFFNNISHEFRTPITLIKGYINQLEVPKNQNEIKLKVDKQIDNITTMINNILDLAKLDSAEFTMNLSLVNISELLYKTHINFDSLFKQKNIDFQLITDNKTHTIKADKLFLERALSNIILNAYKYTEKQGTVTINVFSKNELVHIHVTDTGVGIPKKDLHKIFIRFYQSDNDQNKSGGSGIGLAFSKEIIERHKGTISVDSVEGVTTTFKLSFPVVVAKETSSSFTKKQHIINTKTLQDTNHTSILLVDDNIEILNFLTVVFKKFNVLTAQNGVEALQILEKETVNIVVTDYMMPRMNGLELLQNIKSIYKNIPVIMLTAKADATSKLEALRLGIDDYITKPFENEELLIRVQNSLKNSKERNEFNDKNQETTPVQNKFIKQLHDYVFDNTSSKELNQEELAVQFSMSKSTLYRRVKSQTGLSPIEFINEVKLLKAQKMIQENSNILLKQITLELGFGNTTYFSKLYKNRFGKPPKVNS